MRIEQFSLDESRIPAGVNLDRVAYALERERESSHDEERRIRRALEGWQRRYRARQAELLGSETAALLGEYAARHRHPGPDARQAPSRVYRDRQVEERRQELGRSLHYAHELGVDIGALARLHAAARRDFEEITRTLRRPGRRMETSIVDQGFEHRPYDLAVSAGATVPTPPPPPPPAPQPGTVVSAPYAWWDRFAEGHASGDGEVLRLDSYLWADVGRTGSCVWLRNWDASNFDYVLGRRENGFLAFHTVPANGILKVELDVQCSFSQHCIETRNEWGWSDHTAWTNEEAVVGILWKWEDDVPATETRDPYFVWGLDTSGNGDSSPHTVNPVPAGQLRTLTVYSNMAFPAGVTVLVYVGTCQGLLGYVNDVSLNTFVNSAWFVTQMRVSQG